MICPQCGKQSAPDSNFCSSCGAAIAPHPDARAQQRSAIPMAGARIVRPRSPRVIAGVCSGISIFYGWDTTLVRVLFVVLTILTSGVGILVYIAAWILMPDAPYALPASVQRQGTSV